MMAVLIKIISWPISLLINLIALLMQILIFVLVWSLLTMPLNVFLILRKLILRKAVFDPQRIMGQKGKVVVINFFNVRKPWGKHLGLFHDVLRGRLSLVGGSHYTDKQVLVFKYKPGIFNLYFVRQAMRIDYQSQIEIDREYIEKKSASYDLLLMIRTMVAAFFWQPITKYDKEYYLFGLRIINLNMSEMMIKLSEAVERKKQTCINFVNAHALNVIFKDKEYYEILRKSDFVLGDGIGLVMATKLMAVVMKQNLNGTDLFPFLCRWLIEKKMTLYLLGGAEKTVSDLYKNLKRDFIDLKITGYHHGYFDEQKDSLAIVKAINEAKADVVLVAFGLPQQEKWMVKYASKINAKMLWGVGGLFDFYAQRLPRAAVWMRELGLEWLYRLYNEPRRLWRRYLIGNFVFLWNVLKFKKKHKQNIYEEICVKVD
jgi:N-acetylglucosaminyldiphosphoundecaprenol N-acetyl-beta-D-mannosaminyltransferase